MDKGSMIKLEKFARKIIKLAAEEKLTVAELYSVADMVKSISDNSTVEWEAVAKTDFPSAHIVESCNERELFGD